MLQSTIYCNVYGDERDAILGRWNVLQAAWGTGKGAPLFSFLKTIDLVMMMIFIRSSVSWTPLFPPLALVVDSSLASPIQYSPRTTL